MFFFMVYIEITMLIRGCPVLITFGFPIHLSAKRGLKRGGLCFDKGTGAPGIPHDYIITIALDSILYIMVI